MIDFPLDLEGLSAPQLMRRLVPSVREAAVWIRACEARWAQEFEADAAPTDMRETVEQMLAFLEAPGDWRDANVVEELRERIAGDLEVLVPDPEGEDPIAELGPLELRAYIGLTVMKWTLDVSQGVVKADVHAWIREHLADPRVTAR